jgi:hypothetical protein
MTSSDVSAALKTLIDEFFGAVSFSALLAGYADQSHL